MIVLPSNVSVFNAKYDHNQPSHIVVAGSITGVKPFLSGHRCTVTLENGSTAEAAISTTDLCTLLYVFRESQVIFPLNKNLVIKEFEKAGVKFNATIATTQASKILTTIFTDNLISIPVVSLSKKLSQKKPCIIL